MDHEPSAIRLLLILGVAVASHLVALGARWLGRHALRSRVGKQTKLITITGFATSSLIFAVYFAAIGFALHELGVSLTTYLASASVIGLAVSFGSQGVVQDVITGLTVVFSDLLDVGDMVDIGGQVGIVESVHMRFTVLVNFSGARVFIPNRSITNVINYPKGYIRAFVDVRLPDDRRRWPEVEARLRDIAQSAYAAVPRNPAAAAQFRDPPGDHRRLRVPPVQVPALAGSGRGPRAGGEVERGAVLEGHRRGVRRLDGHRPLPRGVTESRCRQAAAAAGGGRRVGWRLGRRYLARCSLVRSVWLTGPLCRPSRRACR